VRSGLLWVGRGFVVVVAIVNLTTQMAPKPRFTIFIMIIIANSHFTVKATVSIASIFVIVRSCWEGRGCCCLCCCRAVDSNQARIVLAPPVHPPPPRHRSPRPHSILLRRLGFLRVSGGVVRSLGVAGYQELLSLVLLLVFDQCLMRLCSHQ